MKAIDLLEAAQKKKQLNVKFSIVADKNIIEVELRAPDAFDLWKAQEKRKRILLADACAEGMDKYPANMVDWEKEFAKIKERLKDEATIKRYEEMNKPTTMAEQYVSSTLMVETILDLLPQYMREPKTGNLLFPDKDSQVRFKVVLKSNMDIFNMCLAKYVDLTLMIQKTADDAKNL